jgi:hypothetical protein
LIKIDDIEIPNILIKDIESYEVKPWREKNVNNSDYFNYGIGKYFLSSLNFRIQ